MNKNSHIFKHRGVSVIIFKHIERIGQSKNCTKDYYVIKYYFKFPILHLKYATNIISEIT